MGGHVYVGTADHFLYTLRLNSGEVVAKLKIPTIPVGVLVSHDKLLFGVLNSGGGAGGSQILICIDTSVGKILWTQQAPKEWTMRQPFLWGKTVLAGDQSGKVFAYRLADGKEEWSTQFASMIRSIGGDEKTLSIGTIAGTVYAYRPDRRR